jgi:hypothetical protein
MHAVSAANAWHWSEDAFAPASFCVLTVVRDGLRVAPSDQHADGDGGLRELGLDGDAWLEWVRAVLTAHAELGALVAEPPSGRPREVPTVVRHPAELCPGDERLRSALHAMWVSHQANLDAWKRSVTGGPDARRRRGSPRGGREQWKSLAAFHDHLPTLSVLLVSYPVPTVMAVPPATLLVAPAVDVADYTDQVVAGAAVLATEEAGRDR